MPPRSRLTDWLAYAAVRVFSMVVQVFPIDLNLRTARWMGWVWYHVLPRHRQRAAGHLRMAYGTALSERDARRLALASMQQMTMMAMEVLCTPRLVSEWTWARHVKLRNLGEALEILLDGRGAIMCTGHYGNWELLGHTLAAVGLRLTAVMRPLDNPYLNEFLLERRQERGLSLLYKKGAARSADELLRQGQTLCFIADQNAGHKGMFVDFFGVKASTYKSIGLLAMRHEVPVIVGCARRLSPRFEYEIVVNRIIRPEEWKAQPDELRWLTQEYTRAIESFVREAPEQYLWIHRRWKSRPRDERRDGSSSAPPAGPDAQAAAPIDTRTPGPYKTS